MNISQVHVRTSGLQRAALVLVQGLEHGLRLQHVVIRLGLRSAIKHSEVSAAVRTLLGPKANVMHVCRSILKS